MQGCGHRCVQGIAQLFIIDFSYHKTMRKYKSLLENTRSRKGQHCYPDFYANAKCEVCWEVKI